VINSYACCKTILRVYKSVNLSIRLSNYIYINVEAKGENQYHSIVGVETTKYTWHQVEEDSQNLKKGQTKT